MNREDGMFELQAKAIDQQTRESNINSNRGVIYDRNGKILADRILELKNDRTKLVKISENAGRNAKKNALSEICKIITSL